MRKFARWAVPIIGAAVIGKVVDAVFPTVFPKALKVLAAPVPAWIALTAVATSTYLGYSLWNATSPDRARKRVRLAMAAQRESRVPSENELLILRVFGFAGGEILDSDLQDVLSAVAEEAQLTRVELEHAIEALRSAGWLQEQYIGSRHALNLRLSPEGTRYCRSNGWFKPYAQYPVTPHP